MACSSSPPSFCRVKGPARTCKHKTPITEGSEYGGCELGRRWIDEVRQRERPKDRERGHQTGRNYPPHVHGYDTPIVNNNKEKEKVMLMEAMEVMILTSSSLRLVLLCGSLSVCLVSFLVHLNY
ncbi:hypothetical protein BT93_L2183 [Corymbia citriodora subsp. variegata]|uniref:Uncharacterized protein n=1 Tax=Corymbia citriodora subsp. variegata TaxID=360336 RepID=A0A8T0CKX0_CORYI|nr:hypothetical protein BT93_L2183 [Corymbia citriodora subsp. variegata]